MILRFLRNHIILISGILLGAIGGYWSYSTCDGQCIIRSNPYISISHGVLMGAAIASLLQSVLSQNK